MTSIVFTAPRDLNPGEVMEWAPGQLYVNGQPHHLFGGDFVYVCHRNQILFRAQVDNIARKEERIATEGHDKGPGWVVEVADPELPPRRVECTSGRLRYLHQGELW
jgi:hypothetical protein